MQTQRNPLQSLDTRYNSKFLGGKPDALLAGLNVEISNRLTLQRRPGLVAYGTANVPAPTNIYDWQLATTGDINIVLDSETSGGDNSVGTYGGVSRYSATACGLYINKAQNSSQTHFFDIVNTLYMGDGVDLFKCVGPNLLYQSNTFGAGAGTSFSIQSPWTDANVFALTTGQADPLGGTNATQLTWSTTGGGAYLRQTVTPNYTPVASNTFTFSLWMQKNSSSALSVSLEIADQNGNIQTTTFALTQTWTKYQVTTTMKSTSTSITVSLNSPTATSPTMNIYGAQLEIGGPATTTQLTTDRPQGVYRWGIQAPSSAPSVLSSSTVVGQAWQPNTAYTSAIYQMTQVANASAGHTVYTGAFPNGGSNNLSGRVFTIAGFLQTANNGVFTCSASTNASLTLNNANGVAETDPGTATLTVTLTSVSAGTESATYLGTIVGGGSNAYVGYALTVSGFVNPSNNGTFYIQSSTGVSVTVINTNAINETPSTSPTALILGQAVTDANGNLEVAIVSGTSGATTPTWNVGETGTTQDGVDTIFIKQTATGSTSQATSVSVAFPNNVTASDSLVAFVAVNIGSSGTYTLSDSQGNLWTQVTTSYSGPFGVRMYWVNSAKAGATTVTLTTSGGGSGGVWLGILETSILNSVDVSASNNQGSISSLNNNPQAFNTGAITTTNANDFLVSFIMVVAGDHKSSTLSTPTNFSQILGNTNVSMGQGNLWVQAAYEFFTAVTTLNPQWGMTFAAGGSRAMGITAAFEAAATATLKWENFGPMGLTATIGYQYYAAFMNSNTGHVSNVSPISVSTGILNGQSVKISGSGMQITPSGGYSQDPQVDTIALFRNTDGGGFFYQLATFANPGTTTSPGTWTYSDMTPSVDLNTLIYAPIGLLNSPPPAGLQNMEYFAGRMWGSVSNYLYYNTSADNAALLNVTQNGVAPESWVPTNVIPFNAPIVRSKAVGGGLLVCTTLDTWFITGQNLANGGFNQQKVLANHGLLSYNALDVDGSTVYLYTSDRQCLQISPAGGSIEIGFPIGDLLQSNFAPNSTFIARHVSGSADNALFIANASGWHRLNPNQQGASMAGEQAPVWSPFASFTSTIGGISAIASVQTSAGNIQLLVGQATAGPLLYRSLTTFSDNNIPYAWSATFGALLVATPGHLAEIDSIIVKMNNSNSPDSSYEANTAGVHVLIDEISGNFEQLLVGVYDPPQFYPVPSASTVLSQRYYLSQGSVAPIGQFIQVQLTGFEQSGLPATTRDEIVEMTVLGALVAEST